MSFKVLDECYGCGICKFSCPRGAISPAGTYPIRYVVNPILCNDCGRCAALCPVDALVPDPRFTACHQRGCPMTSALLQGWSCSEGRSLCPQCGAVLWKPPTTSEYACPRCDLGMRIICPKTRKLEAGRAA